MNLLMNLSCTQHFHLFKHSLFSAICTTKYEVYTLEDCYVFVAMFVLVETSGYF